MGAQVGGVSRSAPVEPGSEGQTVEGFGRWLRQQRTLRGISIWFVSARTKLAPERIVAIEEEREPLEADGRGRAAARVLASAIGADPEEAVALLGRRRTDQRLAAASLSAVVLRSWPISAAGLLLLVLAGWGLAVWLLAGREPSAAEGEQTPSVVYRTDYVEELLEEDR